MKLLAKLRSKEKEVIISNPHFWSICFIVCALASLYYAFQYNRPFFNEWFPWFWHVVVFEFSHNMNGILFYIPFLYATLIFFWSGTLIVWLVSVLMMLPYIMFYFTDSISLISNIFYLFLPLMIVLFIALDLGWRGRERKAMAERESERRSYMSQIFKIQEDERQRIARELHDGAIQTLLVIANRAQSLSNDLGSKVSPVIKGQTELIKSEILNLKEDMRRLSLDLRPVILDNLGLLPARLRNFPTSPKTCFAICY